MRWWRTLTPRGRTFLIGGGLSSLFAMTLAQPALAWVTTCITLMPLAALASSGLPRLALSATRTVTPPRAAVGEPIAVELGITKRSLLVPALLQFEDAVDPSLGPRPRFDSHASFGAWRRSVTYQLDTRVRGVHTSGPFLVRSTDPFGLTRVDRSFQSTTSVVVTPTLWELPAIRLSSGSGSSGEDTPDKLGVSGHDDVLVREHRQGDDLRRVHWRSTARHGELMVRREEQSLDPSVTILLDSRECAWPPGEPSEEFEWAVSATASMARHLVLTGYRVTIIDAEGVRTSGVHADPASNVEDVVMAMTVQRLSARTSLDHTLARQPASTRSHALIAVLGRLDQADAGRVLSRCATVRGWAIMAADTSREVVGMFAERRWRVADVGTRSVREVWASLGVHA